jgi:sulfite exporter TauE/SafE
MLSVILAALAMGVGTIVSCAALCIPLVLPYAASADRPGFLSGAAPGLAFSIGRLVSYVVLMLFLFFLKSTIQENLLTIAIVNVTSGLVAILSGLFILGAFKRYPAINKHYCLMFKGTRSPFVLGLLAGITPCAPLFAALAFIMTLNSLFTMSLFMLCFWLASTLLIILLSSMSGVLASLLTRRVGLERVRRIASIAIIVIGLVLLIRGLSGFQV